MTLKERAEIKWGEVCQSPLVLNSPIHTPGIMETIKPLFIAGFLAGATDKEALREAFRAGGNLLRPNPSDIGESEPVTDYIERKLAAYLAKKGEGG